MDNPAELATNLTEIGDGVWTDGHEEELSYPDAGYDYNFRLEEESFWFQHRNKCILAAVETFPPPGMIFDVGGGNGFVTAGLRAAGRDAVLVEPAAAAVRNALRRGLRPLICSTLQGAGFLPHSLPAIGLFDVLEHIEDDVGLLRTASGVLTGGGMLYVTAPAYQILWSGADEYAGHLRRYGLRDLVRRVTSAGFVIEYATCFFAPLPPVLFLARTLPYWLGRRWRVDRAYGREHKPKSRMASRLLAWALIREPGLIRRLRRIHIGGSCLVVARNTAL